METLSAVNKKINSSRKALCDLINAYLQKKVSIREFWAGQKLLDEELLIPAGGIRRTKHLEKGIIKGNKFYGSSTK